jgi:hypothetical protein
MQNQEEETMWKNIFPVVGMIIVLIGGAILLSSLLLTPLFDQVRLPLFIAALSSLFSAIGVIGSWLVVLEMQKDRDALFKPEVNVDFETIAYAIRLVVRNDGRSPAHNVNIEITPSPVDAQGKQLIDIIPWLQNPIPTLLPGKRIEKVLGSHINIFERDVPREFEVNMSYESSTGKKYEVDPYTLDLEQFRGSTIPSPKLEYSLHIISEEIKAIKTLIRQKQVE